ncbi:hypothetical protein MLD52_23395, partial [Puniceicoccaceae bacterium K14]|nr:hypothetical protein [Puniceicoccaceae bacterium K14]
GYDLDGNLTGDFDWDYVYDANNRLVKMTNKDLFAVIRRLEFDYDYMGRRVEKRVYHYEEESGGVFLTKTVRFLYATDSMEMLAELNGSGSLSKSFHWGLDKSETRGGAGGAMGLLMIRDYAGT